MSKKRDNAEADPPTGLYASKLHARAESYLRAADILIESDPRESGTVLPLFFLLCHALELTLKAYLSAHGVPRSVLSREIKHSLERAYSDAVERGFQPTNEKVQQLVDDLGKYRNDFRFPDARFDKLYDPRKVADLISHIWEQVQAPVRSAWKRDAGTTSYEVPTWTIGDDEE